MQHRGAGCWSIPLQPLLEERTWTADRDGVPLPKPKWKERRALGKEDSLLYPGLERSMAGCITARGHPATPTPSMYGTERGASSRHSLSQLPNACSIRISRALRLHMSLRAVVAVMFPSCPQPLHTQRAISSAMGHRPTPPLTWLSSTAPWCLGGCIKALWGTNGAKLLKAASPGTSHSGEWLRSCT